MKITVDRVKSDDDATLSIISIDGVFECFGLEDEYRANKVAGETRIPAGVYQVSLRKVGGFHKRYMRKFSQFHSGMLHVEHVPGFEYILIHIGNTDEDTAGCLLVGKNANTTGELSVGNSTGAYKDLYHKVVNAANDDNLLIEYIDSDRG